jgi:hypothetical protein
MSEELPHALRYNRWREWKPIISKLPITEHGQVLQQALGLGSNEVEAAFKYTALTGFEGIEFVVIASHRDTAPFRRLAHGITLVPCPDVLAHAENPMLLGAQSKFLYDGWLPLPSTSEEDLRRGLRLIDETIAILSYSLRSSASWFPKYFETCARHGEYRPLAEADEPLFDDATHDYARLPESLREAVSRAAHWLQHGRQQRRKTDTFLAYWLAFESLVLTLFDVGPNVGLIVEPEYKGLPKKARRAAKGRAILELFERADETNAQQLAQTAYFEVVKGIGKRVRSTLAAILGATHEQVNWPYSEHGGITPSQLRSDLVHGGRSATELETKFNLVKMCSELELLTREIIRRTLHQLWGVEVEQQLYSHAVTMPVTNMIVVGSPGVSVQGDFSITWGLLGAKGLL